MSAPQLLPRESPRLHGQVERLAAYYRRYPGTWASLKEVSGAIGASEAGASARLRDLRKAGWVVDRRRRKGNLWEYHASAPGIPAQLGLL